jgi:hypothetical protein
MCLNSAHKLKPAMAVALLVATPHERFDKIHVFAAAKRLSIQGEVDV